MPRDTQQIIQTAFIRLLNQKPLDRITVKDIVSECNVSRNTFYYYYQDIYALLEQVLLDETEQALAGRFYRQQLAGGGSFALHILHSGTGGRFIIFSDRMDAVFWNGI